MLSAPTHYPRMISRFCSMLSPETRIALHYFEKFRQKEAMIKAEHIHIMMHVQE